MPIDEATQLEFFLWRNQKRYKCPKTWEDGTQCEYDHYNPAEVVDHMRQPHNRSGRVATVRQTVSPIVNSDGEAIIREEAPAPEYKDYRFKSEE